MQGRQLLSDLTRKLGNYLHSGNGEIRFNCPFCEERGKEKDKKHHFYLNPHHGWICFRCGAKGSVPKLLNLLGIDVEFQETVSVDELSELIISLNSLPEVPKLETIQYPEEVHPITINSLAWHYLVTKRKIEEWKIKKFDMMAGNYKDDLRIFVPTFWPSRNMVYWVARKTFNPSDKIPRYTNPSIKDKPFFFNLDVAKDYSSVVITEGVFSSIAVGQNSIAMFGKDISYSQGYVLESTKFDEYIVCLDSDARKESIKLSSWLFNSGKNVSVVFLPENHDPDSLKQKDLQFWLENRIPFNSAMELKLLIGGI